MVNFKIPVSVYSADGGLFCHKRRWICDLIEVNIDASEVKRLADLLEQAPAVIEAAKKDAIAAAAPKMKAIVDEEIGGSGRVRGWQGQYVGSRGLYAAVRPKAKTYAEAHGLQTYAQKAPKRYAVGYITNAINSGHRARGDQFGYQSIPGEQFYQRASARLGQVATEVANNISETVVSHLSGTKSQTAPASTLHAGDFPSFTRSIGGKTYTFRWASS